MATINDYGFPFSSVGTDREYGSEEWRDYFGSLIKDGLIQNKDNECKVKPQLTPNKTVFVDTGSIVITGAMLVVSAKVNLTIDQNTSGQARIDRIVARLNIADRKIEFAVLKGTPAVSPVAKALTRTSTVYELGLADITLANGYSTITESVINDKRWDVSLCGASSMTIGVIPPSGLDAVTVKASQTTADLYHVDLVDANVDALLQIARLRKFCRYDTANGFLNNGFIYDSSVIRTITVPSGVSRVKVSATLTRMGSQLDPQYATVILNGTTTVLEMRCQSSFGVQMLTGSSENIFDVEEGDVFVGTDTTVMMLEEA